MRLVLLTAWSLMIALVARAEPYKADPGASSVQTSLEDWQDSRRDRTVPVKLYVPDKSNAPMPVVLVSHGLGGSRNGMEFIARHWASHGYLVVCLQHPGSDEAVWRGQKNAMQQLTAAANAEQYLARIGDVKFAIDHLTDLNSTDERFKGKVDLDRIAMAGHSFGAQTTQAVSGQLFLLPRGEQSVTEPRIKCSIAFSPAPPMDHSKLAKVFGAIKIPMLHMTGTKDASPIRDTNPEERRLPYDHITLADQYLVIFKDADHMTFSGARNSAFEKRYEVFHRLIQQGTTAFLDAYLLGNEDAKTWLQADGYQSTIGANGTLEQKAGKP